MFKCNRLFLVKKDKWDGKVQNAGRDGRSEKDGWTVALESVIGGALDMWKEDQ